jgi:maleylacetate reductase
MHFIYQPYPVRILFGSPLPQALESELADSRKIWLAASGRYSGVIEMIKTLKKAEVVHIHSEIVQHVPEEQVAIAAESVKKTSPDVLLSIGGGSAVGLVKAIALEIPLPIWAAPTTYSGSEMTNIYGISSGGKKTVGRDDRVLPEKVFYDPALSESMPAGLASKSAMNAMAHLVEAVYSLENNPFSYQSALSGIRSMMEGMHHLAGSGKLDRNINEKFLFGGCLAGKVLCEVTMGLHHKAAHVLGGNFGMDHSGAHTVLLPYVFNYQWPWLSETVRQDFMEVFDSTNPPEALWELSREMGNPITLSDIGFRRSDASSAAQQISDLNFSNPAPVKKDSLKVLLEQAFDGILEPGNPE